MYDSIETLFTKVKNYFHMNNLNGVILNEEPKVRNETIGVYLMRSSKDYPGLCCRINTTTRHYIVNVFYTDDTSTVEHIHLGEHEGHMIMAELEKTDFFESANMMAVVLSAPDYMTAPRPHAHYNHSIFVFVM